MLLGLNRCHSISEDVQDYVTELMGIVRNKVTKWQGLLVVCAEYRTVDEREKARSRTGERMIGARSLFGDLIMHGRLPTSNIVAS